MDIFNRSAFYKNAAFDKILYQKKRTLNVLPGSIGDTACGSFRNERRKCLHFLPSARNVDEITPARQEQWGWSKTLNVNRYFNFIYI
jgi:hypothetical protein